MMALESRPRLRRFVRLRHDAARGRWILLAPERGFVLNGAALAVVRRLGLGTLAEVAAYVGGTGGLGAFADVVMFVQELARRGLVEEA